MRWAHDGDTILNQIGGAGYEVDLQYANNRVETQIAQITNMINSGCSVIIVAPIEGSSLNAVLDQAASKGIKIIAYDRLIRDTENVDYYVTFDNFEVGRLQGEYIVKALGLGEGKGPFNIEITTGDPSDYNAAFFYQGAMDVLKPYIDSGRLVVVSGQTTFEQVATVAWRTETAQARAENIIATYYLDGKNIDAWLCSNDSTALGVANALAALYKGTYPVITGQDCDISNVKNIIAGKQAMSVFKDTRTLAVQTAKMAIQIIQNKTVDVNDTNTFNNNKKVVPTYCCQPVFVDKDNYKTILIDSGYYTEDQLS
jgi:putative multiple sugar transport system substrate-binding protein